MKRVADKTILDIEKNIKIGVQLMNGLILFMACLLVIHHVQIIRLLRHLCDNTSYLERFKASHLHWRQRIVRGRIWNGVDLDTVLKPPPLIRQLYFCSRRGNKENLTTWLIKEKNEPFVVGWVGWLKQSVSGN